MLQRVLLIALFVAAAGCGNGASSTGFHGSNATSGSTGSGATCGQSCEDDLVGYAFDNSMWLFWNQDIVGKSSGPVDFTADCPLGGTAHFTGSTSVNSNQNDNADLTLELSGCGASNDTYELTYDGTAKMHGNFDGNHVDANAMTMSSSKLRISGTVTYVDEVMVTDDCPISVTDTFDPSGSSTQQSWLSGTICGRPIND